MFDAQTAKIDHLQDNFLPSIAIDMNDDLTDPMSIGIFQKEMSEDGKMTVDIAALNKNI